MVRFAAPLIDIARKINSVLSSCRISIIVNTVACLAREVLEKRHTISTILPLNYSVSRGRRKQGTRVTQREETSVVDTYANEPGSIAYDACIINSLQVFCFRAREGRGT